MLKNEIDKKRQILELVDKIVKEEIEEIEQEQYQVIKEASIYGSFRILNNFTSTILNLVFATEKEANDYCEQLPKDKK